MGEVGGMGEQGGSSPVEQDGPRVPGEGRGAGGRRGEGKKQEGRGQAAGFTQGVLPPSRMAKCRSQGTNVQTCDVEHLESEASANASGDSLCQGPNCGATRGMFLSFKRKPSALKRPTPTQIFLIQHNS